jgi:hypothetical protein
MVPAVLSEVDLCIINQNSATPVYLEQLCFGKALLAPTAPIIETEVSIKATAIACSDLAPGRRF